MLSVLEFMINRKNINVNIKMVFKNEISNTFSLSSVTS